MVGVGETRVLVVDDDEPVRTMLRRYLTLEGYEVDDVSDGAAALAAVERQPPDVLLLDVVLPGTDGFDVLASVRRVSDGRRRDGSCRSPNSTGRLISGRACRNSGRGGLGPV